MHNKDKTNYYKLFFYDTENKHLRHVLKHQKWLDSICLSVENIIAIKFLKSWRRARKILPWSAEIIEFMVFKYTKPTICETVFIINNNFRY